MRRALTNPHVVVVPAGDWESGRGTKEVALRWPRVCRLHGREDIEAVVYHYYPGGAAELHPGITLSLCRLAVRQLLAEDPDGLLVYLHQ